MGIVHRDIKPENIIITDQFKLKLANFEIAKKFNIESNEGILSKEGTFEYMAPERITRENCSEKITLREAWL